MTASEDSIYRHWPFDELIENGAATPDTSRNKARLRLSGQELCEGVIGRAPRLKEDEAVNKPIVNGTDWVDVEGRPISAHEGDLVVIFREDGSMLTLSDVHIARRILWDLFKWKAA